MRRQPNLVGGIAREPAAQVIVDAALAAVVQGQRHRLAELGPVMALVGLPQKLKRRRLGKLRRALGAALNKIDVLENHRRRLVQPVHGQPAAAFRHSQLGQFPAESGGVIHDLGIFGPEGLGDALQEIGKARTAVTRRRWKIRAAPKRFGVGRQEHGQRPTPVLPHHAQRRLVNGVDVGTLLAVDLDVDEKLVHQPGDGLVLEAFVGHDMAPVTGGIADR